MVPTAVNPPPAVLRRAIPGAFLQALSRMGHLEKQPPGPPRAYSRATARSTEHAGSGEGRAVHTLFLSPRTCGPPAPPAQVSAAPGCTGGSAPGTREKQTRVLPPLAPPLLWSVSPLCSKLRISHHKGTREQFLEHYDVFSVIHHSTQRNIQ